MRGVLLAHSLIFYMQFDPPTPPPPPLPSFIIRYKRVLGFRSRFLVILIKCALKISDSLPLSKTIPSFFEIIVLLEKFRLSEKYVLIVLQKFLLSNKSFRFTFQKQSFSVFLTISCKSSSVLSRETSFCQIWFH